MKANLSKRAIRRKRIEIPKDLVADFRRRNHVVRLSLFGSVLRADFSKGSDIDVLVEFESEHIPGFLRHCSVDDRST